jgi:peroxiredoxin Q/BCP
LFIYFKDGTYGSKLEQENFRDLQQKFEKLNGVILGVSRDDEVAHANAIKDSNLNYTLLADPKATITKAYDAIDENDRVYTSTFLISPEGKILAKWSIPYGVDRHPRDVLTKLEQIVNGEASDEEKKK